MANSDQTVFIVDDDPPIRKALHWVIKAANLNPRVFASAQEFFDFYDPTMPGCLVLDIRMPGISGLELQDILNRKNVEIPTIFITGHGDVQMAVTVMQKGALDFIEKPFNDRALIDRIRYALECDIQNRLKLAARADIEAKLDRLTQREFEVLNLIMTGRSSREAGIQLKISSKTVEVHRAHIMQKLDVENVVDLTRLVLGAKNEQLGPLNVFQHPRPLPHPGHIQPEGK